VRVRVGPEHLVWAAVALSVPTFIWFLFDPDAATPFLLFMLVVIWGIPLTCLVALFVLALLERWRRRRSSRQRRGS